MQWSGDCSRSNEYDVVVIPQTNNEKYSLASGIGKDFSKESMYNNDDDKENIRQRRRRDGSSYSMSIPKTGIAMALFLTIGGAYLMIYGLLVIFGVYVPKHPEGMWFRVVLGILIFIPGIFHVRLAQFAYLEVPGFSFEDFPEF